MVSQPGTSWMRNRDGMGVWEHRGKVAVAGWGTSYMDRRWDGKSLDKTLGAYAVAASKRAIEDAGLKLDDIDGVVTTRDAQVNNTWAPRPYFAPPYDTEDGITNVSPEWLTKQAGLKNIKFASPGAGVGEVIGLAAQAVGDGLCKVCLVNYGMGNIEGRYGQAGQNATDYARDNSAFTAPWGYQVGAAMPSLIVFKEYCRKYGKSIDGLAPFAVNQRRNGLMTPWGYYSLHEPYQITAEDYLNSRYVEEPLRVLDADRPVNSSTSFIVTTAERARAMKQKLVYILNHCQTTYRLRSTVPTLGESNEATDILARRMWEGSGLGPKDVDVFNPYDGYLQFTQEFLEGFQWHGVKRGEALDFYAGDIRVEGPHPFLSSGGNNGTGRTRTALFIDSIEQLRGMAGKRQIRIRCETALAGATTPTGNGFIMFSKHPS
ncbi:MAG: thiolase family protein [Dehalococcoidia bacterium]|nr:thiolase family protein [Dehalococcoidia bacterium]